MENYLSLDLSSDASESHPVDFYHPIRLIYSDIQRQRAGAFDPFKSVTLDTVPKCLVSRDHDLMWTSIDLLEQQLQPLSIQSLMAPPRTHPAAGRRCRTEQQHHRAAQWRHRCSTCAAARAVRSRCRAVLGARGEANGPSAAAVGRRPWRC